MKETKDILETHAQRRRDFLKSSACKAAAAPAVVLLLQAALKPKFAFGYGGQTDAQTDAP